MPDEPHDYLRRLPKEFYRGRAVVFWSLTIGGRKTGWLTDQLHQRFREFLLHAQHREGLLCAGYTLMPDHLHLVWMGTAERADQQRAMTFLRRHLNGALRAISPGFELQLQGHDRVLREEQRKRGALQRAVHYIFQNSVRAGLAGRAEDWPYSGAAACGYPDLDWRDADYWMRLWKIYGIEMRED